MSLESVNRSLSKNLGGITLGTDSYFPPEAEVRLVRLIPNRDCVNLGTGECTRCISYAIFGQYQNCTRMKLIRGQLFVTVNNGTADKSLFGGTKFMLDLKLCSRPPLVMYIYTVYHILYII